PDAAAVGRVEDGIAVAIGEELAHELVQLAVERPLPVRHRDDVAVIQTLIISPLDEAGADRQAGLVRQAQELTRAGPVRYRLGEASDLVARQLAHVPVAR